MATRTTLSRASSRKSADRPSGPYHALLKSLRERGCVLCRGCYCYMPADHGCAGRDIADRHASRYVVTGTWPNFGLAEREPIAPAA